MTPAGVRWQPFTPSHLRGLPWPCLTCRAWASHTPSGKAGSRGERRDQAFQGAPGGSHLPLPCVLQTVTEASKRSRPFPELCGLLQQCLEYKQAILGASICDPAGGEPRPGLAAATLNEGQVGSGPSPLPKDLPCPPCVWWLWLPPTNGDTQRLGSQTSLHRGQDPQEEG